MLNKIQQFYSPKETKYLTHCFHPYPGKFIPQVVRALIQEYTGENDTILDPFCGSGTSLIEANLLKRNVIGLDLNPLACLISRVKTTLLDIEELRITTRKLMEEVQSKLKRKGNLFDFIDTLNPNIPDFPKREKWFQKHILKELAVLKESIKTIENPKIKDFYLVAFSSIIKDVSNASALYRLTLANKQKNFPSFYVLYKFRDKVNSMINVMDNYTYKTSSSHFVEVYEKDSRLHFDFPQVDFIIANPPSFNFDFARSFKIHLWWLCNERDITKYINNLDRSLIGTQRMNSCTIYLNIDAADKVVYNIKQKRKGVAKALSKYFYDMKTVLMNCYRLLKEDKYCCFQASNFFLYGYNIPVVDTLIELAQLVGFVLEKRITRTVPKKVLIFAKEDKVEEILVFKKST